MSIDRNVINYIEAREKEAEEMNEFCMSKRLCNQDAQKYVDEYCSLLAQIFVQRYEENLTNSKFMLDLLRYLNAVGARDKKSGHRFGNALYDKLTKIEQNKDESTL